MYPALYHAHHSLYSEDIPFWLSLASQGNGAILELGCGTGRVTLALANAGYPVVGLDNDASMLAFLRDIMSPALKPAVKLFQADMRGFHLAEQFGLICLPCNTYSTFSRSGQEAILECVHQHLRPEGIFAVSMPNPCLLSELPGHGDTEIEEVFQHPYDLEPVQVSSAWTRTGRYFAVNWKYDHLHANGEVERLSIQVEHLLTQPSEHINQLRAAGFETQHIYGDFISSEFRSDSPYLILIASKANS